MSFADNNNEDTELDRLVRASCWSEGEFCEKQEDKGPDVPSDSSSVEFFLREKICECTNAIIDVLEDLDSGATRQTVQRIQLAEQKFHNLLKFLDDALLEPNPDEKIVGSIPIIDRSYMLNDALEEGMCLTYTHDFISTELIMKLMRVLIETLILEYRDMNTKTFAGEIIKEGKDAIVEADEEKHRQEEDLWE